MRREHIFLLLRLSHFLTCNRPPPTFPRMMTQFLPVSVHSCPLDLTPERHQLREKDDDRGVVEGPLLRARHFCPACRSLVSPPHMLVLPRMLVRVNILIILVYAMLLCTCFKRNFSPVTDRMKRSPETRIEFLPQTQATNDFRSVLFLGDDCSSNVLRHLQLVPHLRNPLPSCLTCYGSECTSS